ncbi:MAG: CrcB family protein [Myxococcales bacterium]|nr:CrcB family protein [Myxococcales bacterium]
MSAPEDATPRDLAIPDLSAQVLLVALGGGVGAALRGLTDLLVREVLHAPAWTATFGVNLAGAFLIGIAFARLDPRYPRMADVAGLAGDLPGLDRRRRLLASLFVTGGLGAFTTFSTFGLESAVLLEHGRFLEAALSIGGSLILGLAAVALGFRLGHPALQPRV